MASSARWYESSRRWPSIVAPPCQVDVLGSRLSSFSGDSLPDEAYDIHFTRQSHSAPRSSQEGLGQAALDLFNEVRYSSPRISPPQLLCVPPHSLAPFD